MDGDSYVCDEIYFHELCTKYTDSPEEQVQVKCFTLLVLVNIMEWKKNYSIFIIKDKEGLARQGAIVHLSLLQFATDIDLSGCSFCGALDSITDQN